MNDYAYSEYRICISTFNELCTNKGIAAATADADANFMPNLAHRKFNFEMCKNSFIAFNYLN